MTLAEDGTGVAVVVDVLDDGETYRRTATDEGELERFERVLSQVRQRDSEGDALAGVSIVQDPRSQALMKVMDQANAKFGRGTMGMASSAWRSKGPALAKPVWAMNQKTYRRLTPAGGISWCECGSNPPGD
ncbi:DUF4113 domain-containing protein [Lysobacter sp. BMK333-48F3]|uniref:DUF4113 domain-containing protein n=1 Tax=Lysobacter sp. BMK333-48F3 TaxID=2867962 RepID=UPI0031BB25DE